MPFSSLKGKIVVVVNGGPADLPGALKSFARTSPFAKALADAGALGAISIPTPKSMDFPWDRVAANASRFPPLDPIREAGARSDQRRIRPPCSSAPSIALR